MNPELFLVIVLGSIIIGLLIFIRWFCSKVIPETDKSQAEFYDKIREATEGE